MEHGYIYIFYNIQRCKILYCTTFRTQDMQLPQQVLLDVTYKYTVTTLIAVVLNETLLYNWVIQYQ